MTAIVAGQADGRIDFAPGADAQPQATTGGADGREAGRVEMRLR